MHETNRIFFNFIIRTPLKKLAHCEWDISSNQDNSTTAVLYWKDGGYTIKISGQTMIDFDCTENQIAWHLLQNESTGWYIQPQNIVLEEGVSNIGKYSFADLSSIERVVIPKTITTIDDYAFLNCLEIETINYNGTIEEWNAIILGKGWNKGTRINQIICTNGNIIVNN